MHRVKKIEYDDDDYYSDEGEDYTEEDSQGYTAEDRENFATYTPAVRAELEEAGLQASDREIEDALWHYYWDVGKSVAYLKNTRTPRTPQQQTAKKEKAKSRFDQAAEKSAERVGELDLSIVSLHDGGEKSWSLRSPAQRADLPYASRAIDWFRGIPWTGAPSDMIGVLSRVETASRPQLLGGSSKLAKLAEERRKKASGAAAPTPNGALSSLDRLSKPRETNENEPPAIKAEPKKYPVRKKKEPSPPPREPTPPPVTDEAEPLPNLRATPTAFARTLSTSPQYGGRLDDNTIKDALGLSASNDPFKDPSPDDTVLRAQQRDSSKGNQNSNNLAKKTEALKLDQTASTPPPPKVKSKGLDVPKLWAEEKSKRKASAAFVVIGHVDHGKSTLMGRLLLDTGAVSQRDIDKYKKQAADIGKSSFALAWVMDTGSEERERGVTVDIAQFHFSTDTVDFTILDAPGHRDFVPNMIGGASMADFAVLVVDANQLESGMKGQTKEHILLAKACGIEKVVVAVNKLDASTPAWNENVFKHVSTEISRVLADAGFAEGSITFVPCSGLSGQNVVKAASDKGDTSWIAKSSGTLLAQLEKAVRPSTTEERVRLPLRLQIADVFRGGVTNPLSVAGRISSGSVQVGDSVIIQPSGETATIRGIEVSGDGRDWAVANQLCTLHLTDIDPQHLRAGDVLCSAKKPVAVVRSSIAQLQAFESLLPQSVDVYVGRLSVSGAMTALISTVDGKGDIIRKKPRVVQAGSCANVKLVLDNGAPLDGNETVILRADGTTLAAGKLQRVGG